MAAIVVINSDVLKTLEKFQFTCKSCQSDKIEIEISWGAYPSASWNRTIMICKNCHQDEELTDE